MFDIQTLRSLLGIFRTDINGHHSFFSFSLDWLKAKNTRGCTPLMLAAMGNCSEHITERILEFGGVAIGAALRSEELGQECRSGGPVATED